MTQKILKILLLMITVLLATAIASADTSLDQNVPFGLTCSKDGQLIPVFDSVKTKNKTDLLQPNQLCALDYTTIQGKHFVYHIVYPDETGEFREGFVKESNFEQLTLTAYTDLLKDPEQSGLIDQFVALSETSTLFFANAETDTDKQPYVLNTNTKKFHDPECRSVKTIKEKNRKDYTGTREEIIEMGFVPCKNCNP